MATIKQLTEGQDFINSLLNSLPSHHQVNRRYLPPELQALLPPAPERPAAPAPRPAAPRPAPQAAPAAPTQQAAPQAPAADYGDPGVGTKTTRFNAMYQRMNGTGLTRSEFVDGVMQRLQMTRAGATTYMANAARAYGAWRLR